MDLIERRKIYMDLSKRFEPNTFLTLVTNQTWTAQRLRKLVGSYFARMDRWYLGHTWHIEPYDRRINGMGFIEHEDSNIHIHLLVNFKSGNEWGRRMMTEHYWHKFCESGSIEIEPIYDLNGAAYYCTKEMTSEKYDVYEQVVFLQDYTRS